MEIYIYIYISAIRLSCIFQWMDRSGLKFCRYEVEALQLDSMGNKNNCDFMYNSCLTLFSFKTGFFGGSNSTDGERSTSRRLYSASPH